MNKINVHEMAHICEPLGCFGYLEILGMGTSGGTIHVLLPPRRDASRFAFPFHITMGDGTTAPRTAPRTLSLLRPLQSIQLLYLLTRVLWEPQ
jgi:hypothetical protein